MCAYKISCRVCKAPRAHLCAESGGHVAYRSFALHVLLNMIIVKCV